MANKAALIAQLDTSTRGVVKVEPVITGVDQSGNPIPEVLTLQNGKTARKYTVNLARSIGDTVTFENVPLVVFNEGLADEEAVLSQGVEAPRVKDFETRAKNYLQGKVNDGVFLGFRFLELNEEFKYVVAQVIENVAGTMTRKKVCVYKPASNPITHVPFTE